MSFVWSVGMIVLFLTIGKYGIAKAAQNYIFDGFKRAREKNVSCNGVEVFRWGISTRKLLRVI